MLPGAKGCAYVWMHLLCVLHSVCEPFKPTALTHLSLLPFVCSYGLHRDQDVLHRCGVTRFVSVPRAVELVQLCSLKHGAQPFRDHAIGSVVWVGCSSHAARNRVSKDTDRGTHNVGKESVPVLEPIATVAFVCEHTHTLVTNLLQARNPLLDQSSKGSGICLHRAGP